MAPRREKILRTVLAFVGYAVLCSPPASAGLVQEWQTRQPRESASCRPATTIFKYNVTKYLASHNDYCRNQGTVLLAYVGRRVLYLCKNNRAFEIYPMATGDGGYPKRYEGDRKTPIGTYDLEYIGFGQKLGPRIKIDYPNAQDKAAGRTGSLLRIHAPFYGRNSYGYYRDDRCDGMKTLETNWTNGCLALASDASVYKVAEFVQNNAPIQIRIME